MFSFNIWFELNDYDLVLRDGCFKNLLYKLMSGFVYGLFFFKCLDVSIVNDCFVGVLISCLEGFMVGNVEFY